MNAGHQTRLTSNTAPVGGSRAQRTSSQTSLHVGQMARRMGSIRSTSSRFLRSALCPTCELPGFHRAAVDAPRDCLENAGHWESCDSVMNRDSRRGHDKLVASHETAVRFGRALDRRPASRCRRPSARGQHAMGDTRQARCARGLPRRAFTLTQPTSTALERPRRLIST